MRPESATSGPTGVTGSTDVDGGRDADSDPRPGTESDAKSRAEFDVQIVDRIGAADPAEWDAAVRILGLPVFYSRAFLAAYEQHPLTDIDACAYLLVRHRGELVAVVPAYLQARPDPLGALASTYPQACRQPALLSHVWHCYDTHLGGSAVLAAAVMSALRARARELGAAWCGLVNVHSDGPTARALAAAGLPTRHLVDRFTAELTGIVGMSEFLDRSMRPAARRELGRYRRRAAEHGVTDAVVPIDQTDLSEVAALCVRSASKHGSTGYYPPGRFERFLAALGPAARVVEIRQRGRLVSVGVCLLDATRLHCWAGGADYRVDGNFSPYYLMFGDAISLAFKMGRTVFEGGRGNPVFKLRHGLAARPLVGCLVPA